MSGFDHVLAKRNTSIEKLREELQDSAVLVFERDDCVFTDQEWDVLERHGLQSDMPYETVVLGDAGEPNLVEVGRLMTDVDQPRLVNEHLAMPMIEILAAPQRVAFFQQLLGVKSLHLRRGQINKMHTKSFIGLHVDQDSNPDYQISVVLQFGHDFTGGEFVVKLPNGEDLTVEPKYRTVIIARCDLAHEVKEVKSGTRTSLVYFVSEHAGRNRRHEITHDARVNEDA